MAFALNVKRPRPDPFPIEAEAARLTWAAWRARQHDRLFDISELKFEDKDTLRRWDQEFAWKAVGVVPPIESNYDGFLNTVCVVGVWLPEHRDHFGSDVQIQLRSLQGAGSTTYRSPLNVGFVHVLPALYQRYGNRWDEDSDDCTCGHCGYRFKDDEDPCRDCRRCAGCCYGQGSYGVETCQEVDASLFREYLEEADRRAAAARMAESA